MTQLTIDGEPTDDPKLMNKEERHDLRYLRMQEAADRRAMELYKERKVIENARHREETRKANKAWLKAKGIFNHRESSCWLIGGTDHPKESQWP